MKKLIIVCFLFLFVSCFDEGENLGKVLDVSKIENNTLPESLQNLQVYCIGTTNGGTVMVGILNDTLNSLTYQQGKTQETIIMINNKNSQTKRIIEAKEILSETDDIIVIRKK